MREFSEQEFLIGYKDYKTQKSKTITINKDTIEIKEIEKIIKEVILELKEELFK